VIAVQPGSQRFEAKEARPAKSARGIRFRGLPQNPRTSWRCHRR
jgi:hypothetical protein